MLPAQNHNHVVEARALLIEQFKSKRVIQGFLDTYIRRLQDVENVLWDIINSRILDNAIGAQLDMLGDLVQEARRGRADDLYRLGVRIRIVVNRSKGRAEDVIKVATLANAPASPRYVDQRYLNFFVETYTQLGERFLVDYLSQTRAASSYGTLIASDLPVSDLLQFDDATAPAVGVETFGDLDRTGARPSGTQGCGKLAAAGYGLPQPLRGLTLVGDPTAYPPPRIDCIDSDGAGGNIIHGAFFTGATSVKYQGVDTSFVVVNDARISVPNPPVLTGGTSVDSEGSDPLLTEGNAAVISVTTAFGVGDYPLGSELDVE